MLAASDRAIRRLTHSNYGPTSSTAQARSSVRSAELRNKYWVPALAPLPDCARL